jgi:hypothetical protein
LASLPEAGDPTESFDRFERLLDSIVLEASEASVNQPPGGEPLETDTAGLSSRLKEHLIWNAKNKPEPPAPIPEGQNTEKILQVAHFPQDGQVYCVLACIRMIANSLGVQPLPTQSVMATQLEEPPPSLFTDGGGVLPSNQTDAFRRLLPAEFQVTFDDTPNWQKFVDEIEAERAFKSGITGHARVVVGYQITMIGPVAGSPAVLQRSLWINDPAKTAGMMFEPHELAELDPADLTRIVSTTPRIPFKNNSVLVRRP